MKGQDGGPILVSFNGGFLKLTPPVDEERVLIELDVAKVHSCIMVREEVTFFFDKIATI